MTQGLPGQGENTSLRFDKGKWTLRRKTRSCFILPRHLQREELNEPCRDVWDYGRCDPGIADYGQDPAVDAEDSRTDLARNLLRLLSAGRHSLQVREEGTVVKKAVYIAIGTDMAGMKEVLGLWIGETGKQSIMAGGSEWFEGSW